MIVIKALVTYKWFCACLKACDNHICAYTLTGREIVKKKLQVAIPTVDIARCHKREDSSATVGAFKQLPRNTVDCRRSDWCTSCAGDRACTTVFAQPDHYLILIGGGCRWCKP